MRFRMTCLLALACAAAAAAAADALKPTDFAFGRWLEVERPAAIYGLALPLAVYENAVHEDLADLRVFDAAGEPVAHGLRIPPVPEPVDGDWETVPFTAAVASGQRGSGRSHVLDLGEAGYVGRLQLQWQPLVGTRSGYVRVDSSEDLAHWRPLVPRAGIASLQFGDAVRLHDRISIAARAGRYLRVTWSETLADLQPVGMRVTRAPQLPPPAWQARSFSGLVQPGPDGTTEVHFQVPAALPVASVSLDLPVGNTLVEAAIDVRAGPEAPWRACGSGQFYRLQGAGRVLTNTPLPCRQSGAEWRVRLPAGQWQEDSPPRLQLRWLPHELRFAARGDAPWLLAWGRSAEVPPPASVNRLLAGMDAAGVEVDVAEAQLQQAVTLGGPARLRAPAPAVPWQRVLLWLVLVAGVAALGLMARSLWREMRGAEP